jgi:hypothetical protein
MKTFYEWLQTINENTQFQPPVPPRNELEKYYLDLLLKLHGPQKIQNLFKNFEGKKDSIYDPYRMYYSLFDALYKNIRTPNKNAGEHYDDVPHQWDIHNKTSQSTQLVQAKNENGWHYRQPHSYAKHPRAQYAIPKGEVEGRISFAALANPKLIDILDDYVANKRLAYYKTPENSADWTERHDPITMYFKEPITPEIKSELANIFNNKNFNRSMHKNNPLTGDQFSPGMSEETTPRKEEVIDMVQKISAIDPIAGQAAKAQMETAGNNPRPKASAGQIAAAQQLLKLLPLSKKPLNNTQQPQTTQQQPQQQQINKPQQPTQQPQTNKPFSLSSLADKMGDPDWHQLYDVFARQIKLNPKNPQTQELGKALYNWAQGNKKDAEPFLDKYVRAQKIR